MSSLPRRPMSAALKTADLSPEEMAFVTGGTPSTTATIGLAKPDVSRLAVDPPLEPEMAAPAVKHKSPLRKETAATGMASGLVNLSFRIPAEIHVALMRASFDRKLQRQEPWTQQEIVADAIAAWLKKQGYL